MESELKEIKKMRERVAKKLEGAVVKALEEFDELIDYVVQLEKEVYRLDAIINEKTDGTKKS